MAITMHHRGANSERRCARQMRLIEQGRFPLEKAWYTALEVAGRYEVHVQSVYDGISVGHALYPLPFALWPKPWVMGCGQDVGSRAKRSLLVIGPDSCSTELRRPGTRCPGPTRHPHRRGEAPQRSSRSAAIPSAGRSPKSE